MHQVGTWYSREVAAKRREEQYKGAITREDLYRAMVEHNENVLASSLQVQEPRGKNAESDHSVQ